MPPPPTSPLLEVMRAQKENLNRIELGLELEGTTADGNPLVIQSRKPELIRLLDTPLALQQKRTRAETAYERILTIAPVRSKLAGKISNRRDLSLSYLIHGLVTLSKAEMVGDEASSYEENPLSDKLMGLANDVEMLIFDDYHLGGIVQEIVDVETSWNIDYPVGGFAMVVNCFVSAIRTG